MGVPMVVKLGPMASASSNNIATAQSLGAAGALTLNGSTVSNGVATLDIARRVLISSVGNDTGITFTVTGTNHTGNAVRETITGANTGLSVYTSQDYLSVSSITASGATAANVTVGTNQIASSPWKALTYYLTPIDLGIQVVVTGTCNYTAEFTLDPINSNMNVIGSQGQGNYPTPPNPFPIAALTSQTGNAYGSTDDPIVAWRITLNSESANSFVVATGIQAGISE